MTDIAIRLLKMAEDLSSAQGYSGYVRTLTEAAAELTRLRKAVRVMKDTQHLKNLQKGKQR